MHESMKRLYEAVAELKKLRGQSNVARLLGKSPQVLKNWEERGISNEAAIGVQEILGISAVWIREGKGPRDTANQLVSYPVPSGNIKKVWVVGKGQGGLPERIWTDGDYPVGATDEYAEVATSDNHAFLITVEGNSMAPRYQPGEFALVEPDTEPDLEDDVLVRLATGETMLKRLLSRRAGYRFGSWNDQVVLSYRPEEVVWVYYVAHPVPARKIKHRL